MITTEEFSKNLLGYNIVDCVVRRRDFFYFIAQEDYTQRAGYKAEGRDPDASALIKRIIVWRPDQADGKRWAYGWRKGMDITIAEFGSVPEDKLVIVDTGGIVYAVGGGTQGLEGELPFERSGRYGSVDKLRNIGGELYLAGGNRTVGIRRGVSDWRWETERFPLAENEFGSSKIGFRDIDGFNTSDIYAVGGHGDVWHFDGKNWGRVDFPSNQPLRTVCCAGDGNVYVSGYDGITFVGRGSRWRCIAEPAISLPFRDLVWYGDRVWATNDYGLWWVDPDGVKTTDLPATITGCAGNLSARDGLLLLAGYYGAALLQDGEWKVVFHYAAMHERSKEDGRTA
ncbi:MAG: hypothetical protein JNN30_16835 [Rhodanobacteraceae bacterium]|nr:hypothetical protein [Rhodanobacteraceae bacterium]